MKYDVLLASIKKKGVEIPRTLLAFDPGEVTGCCVFKDGKPVETLVGFMPKESIVQKVKSHL